MGDDAGHWQQLETYFLAHSAVKFTPGIGSDCADTPMKPPAARRVR